MKIIHGHDYYDSALGFGRDEDLVFVRDSKIISTKSCPLWDYYPHDISTTIKDSRWGYSSRNEVSDEKHGRLSLCSVSVYVAGVRYGGVAAVNVVNQPIETFWDFEHLESWLANYKCRPFKPKKEIYSWSSFQDELKQFPDLHAWFTVAPATPDQLTWLIEHRSAIAIACYKGSRYKKDSGVWHVNAADPDWALKTWGFARAVDPYTLFQELSMFVGGVLPRNPNPMVEITDPDVKVAKHGFDKWSFRKHKDDPVRQKEQ